jgi:hypothetical protein
MQLSHDLAEFIQNHDEDDANILTGALSGFVPSYVAALCNGAFETIEEKKKEFRAAMKKSFEIQKATVDGFTSRDELWVKRD